MENQATATVVENPFGLEAMWAAGDWVAKGTLIIKRGGKLNADGTASQPQIVRQLDRAPGFKTINKYI